MGIRNKQPLFCILSIVSFLLVSVSSTAQRINLYSYQFGAQTDNDSYAFTGRDRYYSNGLFFSFRKAIDTEKYAGSKSTVKKIIGFELGQEMYMPFTAQRGKYREDLIDRPFAGYIYLKGMYDVFYKNESTLNFSASLGLIGPATGVDNLQEWVHHTFGYYEPQGWEHQIDNSIGIDLTANYKKVLIKDQGLRNFDVAAIGEGRVGTFFNGASAGVLIRAGILEKIFNSGVYDAKLSNGVIEGFDRDFEWSFYAAPMINYVAYDATIQGNIFLSKPATEEEIIKEPKRVVFTHKIGFLFTKNRFGLDLSYHYKSREVMNAIKATQYGSIKFLYFFN